MHDQIGPKVNMHLALCAPMVGTVETSARGVCCDGVKRLGSHVSDLGAGWDHSRFMVRPTVVAVAPVTTTRASARTKASAVAALPSDSPTITPPQNLDIAGSQSRQSPEAFRGAMHGRLQRPL
jgi:hypothetical protein